VVCQRDEPGRIKHGKDIIEELVVRSGDAAGLDDRSTEATTVDWLGDEKKKHKKVAEEDLQSFVDELTVAQQLFWANDTHALLIVLQAMTRLGRTGPSGM
jgi:hypothetical protein